MVKVDISLLDTIYKDESRKPMIEHYVKILDDLSKKCGFTTCYALPNIELEWINPITGYVCQIPKNSKFHVEPFLISMFRGISVLPVDNHKIIPKLRCILNGTIKERSPQPFDPNDNQTLWIPSLGDKDSYIGLYAVNISDKQSCLICDVGLDYEVECKLQKFFVEQEDQGKTYGEVFSSRFVNNIRWYSMENRRRLLHVAGSILGLIHRPITNDQKINMIQLKTNLPKLNALSQENAADILKTIMTALEMYCNGTEKNYISPYFCYPNTSDVNSKFQNYPLGPILYELYTTYKDMFVAIQQKLKQKHKFIFDIISSDTANRSHIYDYSSGIYEFEYNYISLHGDTCTFYSGCMSTSESRGCVFSNRRVIYGPNVFMNKSTHIERTTHWVNDYHNAFPITTPNTGIQSNDNIIEPEFQAKFISNIPLVDNLFFNKIRYPIDIKLVNKLGFKFTGSNKESNCTPILVKLTG